MALEPLGRRPEVLRTYQVERLGKDADKLLEDIPHLARVRDRGWSSMRVIIEERRQQSPPHRGRPELEL